MGGATKAYNRFTPKYQLCFISAVQDLVDDELYIKISQRAEEKMKRTTLKNLR